MTGEQSGSTIQAQIVIIRIRYAHKQERINGEKYSSSAYIP